LKNSYGKRITKNSLHRDNDLILKKKLEHENQINLSWCL